MDRKEQAVKYLGQGLSIIPIVPKGKNPIIKTWKEYQTRQATEKEVNEWFSEWSDVNIGIVTGKISGIIVIDVDSEEAMQLVKEKGMPKTPMVKTARGYHLYCKYSEGVRNFQKRADLPGIDLRAEGGYVVAPPSVHESGHAYSWMEGCEFGSLPLADLPGWIFAKDNSKKTPIEELLKGVRNGERHNALLRLIGHWLGEDLGAEECLQKAEEWNFRNEPPLDKKEVANTVKDACERYGKQSTSQNDKTERYSAYFEGLVDIVDDKGNPSFLIKDKGQLIIASQWDDGGVRVAPPPKEAITWLLPRAEEVLKYFTSDNNKQLYADLLAYHKNISELPSEEYYDLLVVWVFHTYLLEHFRYSPYLYFFAITERGKSRTGQGLIYVAYRGYRTETLNEAQIIRLANNCKVTLFIDATDLWKNAERKAIEDVILGRFEKGSKIPRVLYPEKGAFKDTVYFEIFGATIIASNVKVNEVLETRAIEINMPETNQLFDNDVTPEFSLPLKERLVAFRARHLNDKLPKVDKPTKGRLGDILKPLFQTIRFVNSEREEHFIKLIEIIETGKKLERSTSWEAELLKAVIKLEQKVEKGLLLTKHVVDLVNLVRTERFKFSSNRVGRDLDALGFDKKSASNGNSAIVYDKEKIKRLKARYGIKNTSEISESSEKRLVKSSISGISEVPEDLGGGIF